MKPPKYHELRGLEGCHVHLALADGSRVDDAALVSATARTVWVFTNGEDRFVPTDTVVDVWEVPRRRLAA
ncbi:MAG: hypothetical protein M3326_07175 [Actinomycetota bacterium]|nr:hypothetical protein [Actinomycetota bacterium]